MGHGVSLIAPKDGEYKLKKFLKQKKKVNKLFSIIASSASKKGHVDISTSICLTELITYYARPKDEIFKSMHSDVMVAKQAFKYVTGRPLQNNEAQVSRKQFPLLVVTLFLFSELWKIFGIMDDQIDDKKIFKGEFLRARENLKQCEGVLMSDVTAEEWEKHFDVHLDSDGNGYISFGEFCTFVCKHIVDPWSYIADDKEDKDEDQEQQVPDILYKDVKFSSLTPEDMERLHEDISGALVVPTVESAPTSESTQIIDKLPSDMTPKVVLSMNSDLTISKTPELTCSTVDPILLKTT